jgi:hypothetical protein
VLCCAGGTKEKEMNLAELKKMDRDELYDLWYAGKFPFEIAACGACITQHRHESRRFCREGEDHAILSDIIAHIPGANDSTPYKEFLFSNLEQLYAARLFYAQFYRDPVPEDAFEARIESATPRISIEAQMEAATHE